MAGNKVHFEGPGHEQVFLEGEAPLLFHEVFDIVVPVLGRLPGGRAVHLQKKLGQLGIRADGSPVQGRGDAAVDGLVGPDDGMHVAAGQQGLDAQAQGRGLGAGDIGLVAHEEDMPPRQQHELAGQGHITEAIAERGPEPGRGGLHVFVPAREVYARMFAAREEEFPACHEQGFLERGEQHMAACGPGKLGDEQAVVLARIAAYQRAGGIVAQTVGLQPLLTEGLAQVLAGRTVKLEFHVSSSTGKDGHIRGDRGEGRCIRESAGRGRAKRRLSGADGRFMFGFNIRQLLRGCQNSFPEGRLGTLSADSMTRGRRFHVVPLCGLRDQAREGASSPARAERRSSAGISRNASTMAGSKAGLDDRMSRACSMGIPCL